MRLTGSRMAKYLAIAAALFLAGCQQTVDEMSYPDQKKLAQEISQRCIGYGLTFGSEEHKTCVLSEARREISLRENARRRRESGITCQTFGTVTSCF
jgi:hypothetical protein